MKQIATAEPNEVWKPIPGVHGYSASNQGRIRVDCSRWASMNGRVLSLSHAGRGYLKCSPKSQTMYVHALVALAFIGQRPEDMEINHIDGDKENNRPENLEYVSRSQNGLHAAVKLGKHRGEANGISKLTEKQVLDIRSDRRPQGAIAAEYGICQAQVSNIKLRRAWAHVKGDV